MSKITGGELLVETLRDQGVRHVFSIIGGQMCSIYDALSRYPDMNLVTVRNEAAAPMMAAGCTAVTGVPSVSMCTVGAGVVYEVAGIMAAWYQYLPVISIAPQVQSWKMKPHQENLQGCNQDEIFYPITKWNAIIYHWDRIPSLIHRALREAQANAPGPVHLDVPVDVLFLTKEFNDSVKAKLMRPAANTRYIGALPGPVEKVEKAREAVLRSQKPIVLIGQGYGRPGRYPQIRDYLNNLGLPVLTSDASSGILNGNDSSYAGPHSLFIDSAKGLDLLRESDMILIIGMDDQVGDLLEKLRDKSPVIVQVEIDPSALLVDGRNIYPVNADPESFLSALKKSVIEDWLDKVRAVGDAIESEFNEHSPGLAILFAGISDDDTLVIDGAGIVEAAKVNLRRARYRNLFFMNTRDMAGTGFPFAMGVKIGMPRERVTLITDKDSLCRHLQEIQTARGLGLDITIVCAEPEGKTDPVRTEAILDGLGCEIGRLKIGEKFEHAKTGRPRAWICEY